MRMEEEKAASTALIILGAPSVVTVVGRRMPLASMWRKNSVHAASDSLLPTARSRRCFRPSESMH
jgi:hypothetical protein